MQGKIVKGIAGFYYVHVVESGIYECKAKGAFRKEKIKPLVGDNVRIDVLDEGNKTGNIVEILPRQNELIRPAVANIDQALVVFAVTKPKPHFNLLDRFLIMMECKEIPVILCFNKKDIATNPEVKELQEIYELRGYEMIFTSAMTEENVDEVKAVLKGKTTAVAGPSGVGKSSLINLLQSEVEMETGVISEKIERGKHTTRHSELLPIDENSYIMDTPGFSSLYVNDFEKEELKYYFPEFEPYEGQCKFQGCDHVHEPKCAVKEAVEQGKIHSVRYNNYLEMYKELQEKGDISMGRHMILAPSLLAADFKCLGEEMKKTEENGAEYLHFDVMDGKFVPSISFGMPVLASIKSATNQVMDVHLMIEEPIRYVEDFKKAGADYITVHLEACEDVRATLLKIKECGLKTGLSICPDTPVAELKPYLDVVDMILIMSVHPGFGGQKFIENSLDKIRETKEMVDASGLSIDIEVDGGIYTTNVREVLEAGANVIVAGSAVFKGDAAANTKELMEIMKSYEA